MLTPAELAACQADQLASMTGTCEIRLNDVTTLDPSGVEVTVDGQVAAWWQSSTVVPCRVATAGGDIAGVSIATVGEQRVATRQVVVTVPVDVVPVPDRMLVKVLTCPDPRWVGRKLPIVGVAGSTYPTARRLVCLAEG